MSEERMRILKMLGEGKVTADEAAKLLDAIGKASGGPAAGTGRKMLRVLVHDGGKEAKVNVNIPIELIKVGMQFIPEKERARMEEWGISLDSIIEMIQSGAQGKLVDIEQEGKRVEVVIE
jgi:hypothetical protein